jgi:hypothetical protein
MTDNGTPINKPPTSIHSVHSVSDEEREFFYQLGSAVTEWAKIDELLFHICEKILKISKKHTAIIYYRNNTLGGRYLLVDELVKASLPDNKSWSEISKNIVERLRFRNQLAHSPSGPRAEIKHGQGDSWHITDFWWASYTSISERYRGKEPSPDIKINDIKSHIQDLALIWMQLRQFETQLE